jgi:hypothetical protein
MKSLLPKPMLDDASLRRLGFRCLAPTLFSIHAGESVTVQADSWMLADTTAPRDPDEARCLRFYHVLHSNGRLELLDENDVIGLVGKIPFEESA